MTMSRAAAWFVHLYTASGIVFALLATLELCKAEPDPRWVFVWLTIAVLVDATDGLLARRFHVKKVLPHIQGRTIDDIVDYLTFTFIPMLLIARLGWVPQPALLFVAPALMTSLLGFSNTGAKDEEGGFFLGFPSYWNIVAFYLGIAALYGLQWLNAIVVLALAALTVMPVAFIYPNLAPRRWKATIMIGAFVWLVMIAAMLPRYPHAPLWLVWLSLVYPVFYTTISIAERSRRPSAPTGGHQ
ncbi:MAG TPA: phosphatidylcholine synthase [Thermoanaerobaculia bacterium]|nr:phosphatidylcholine synthase [Thermoanaerobaculia bacterium]